MKSGKKFLVGVLALGASMIGYRSAKAETIEVFDKSSVPSLIENTTTGEFQYQVDLTIPKVEAGDGFVITDFGPVASWSLSGTGGLSTSSWTMYNNTTTGANAALTDSGSGNAFDPNILSGNIVDSPSVLNVTFVYNGPPLPDTTSATAVLTIFSGLTLPITINPGGGAYASIDHSGTVNLVTNPHGYHNAESTLDVPAPGNAVPVPSSLLGASMLLGLIGLGKARRLLA